MSEMVERVARAFAAAVSGYELSDEAWKACVIEVPEDVENFRRSAREAIAVMREPTQSMMDVGLDAVGHSPNFFGYATFEVAEPISAHQVDWGFGG